MLKIAVCIKQVPLVEDVNFDFENKTIKRDGANVISAFDLRAIALAVDLKTRLACETTVITMGPPQAREALIEALAMGIDSAVHLEDRYFAGADTLATARALSQWLATKSFDLILLGKYTLDAETGQVGPEIAELLGIAQVTGVRKLDVDGQRLVAERESDEGFDEVECAIPALITCAERLIKPIRASAEAVQNASTKAINVVRLADLDGDSQEYGLAGSPTWVEGTRIVEQSHRRGELIATSDPEETAQQAVKALQALGALRANKRTATIAVSSALRRSASTKDIWIACETNDVGELTTVSLELATCGGRIADQIGGALVALLFNDKRKKHAPTLASYGVDRVLIVDVTDEIAYSADTAAASVAGLVLEHRPWGLFLPASERGRDWGPRLAARLGLGLTGDVIDLKVDEAGRLVAFKPAFGGNMVAEIYSKTFPQMATVRPGMLGLGEPAKERVAEVITAPIESTEPLTRLVRSHSLINHNIAPLEQANIVIGIGMGIGGPAGVEQAKELAQTLGASICATRRVCDANWLPRQLQVGLTGKCVNADLYIAVGVRGAPNHTVGLKGAGTILAINKDPKAPIFEWADIGIVGTCEAMLPALTKVFQQEPNMTASFTGLQKQLTN